MTWRGNIEPLDRLLGSLPYLLPLSAVFGFGGPVFALFPPLFLLFQPFLPLLRILGQGGFLVFILLFFLVVRNPRIKHFIRFNTMQAILLDLAVILVVLLLQLVGMIGLGLGALVGVITLTLFLGITGSTFYAWFENARGHYAELPSISDTAYSQVR